MSRVAVVVLVLVAAGGSALLLLLASATAATSSNACAMVRGTTKLQCVEGFRAAGCPVAWRGPGCAAGMGDGGCQPNNQCPFCCAERCALAKECSWTGAACVKCMGTGGVFDNGSPIPISPIALLPSDWSTDGLGDSFIVHAPCAKKATTGVRLWLMDTATTNNGLPVFSALPVRIVFFHHDTKLNVGEWRGSCRKRSVSFVTRSPAAGGRNVHRRSNATLGFVQSSSLGLPRGNGDDGDVLQTHSAPSSSSYAVYELVCDFTDTSKGVVWNPDPCLLPSFPPGTYDLLFQQKGKASLGWVQSMNNGMCNPDPGCPFSQQMASNLQPRVPLCEVNGVLTQNYAFQVLGANRRRQICQP